MLNFSIGSFGLCIYWDSAFQAYLMTLIARCGLLLLSALVIFAFFEVRYDTLRRRDKEAVSVNCLPTECFRASNSGVIPCALQLGLALPGRVL